MPVRVPLRARVVVARAESKPKTGTAVVSVALKNPNGLQLQGFRKIKRNEATPLGFREIEEWIRYGEPFILKGNAMLLELQRKGIIADTGGYAITNGCPLELWEQWFENNEDSALVRNGLIFACATEEEAMQEARNCAKIRSGMEPVDPDHPELVTGMRKRNVNAVGGLSAIEAGERPG